MSPFRFSPPPPGGPAPGPLLVELTAAVPEAEALAAWDRFAGHDERARAAFRDARLARRHVHAHGALRHVIARNWGCAPGEVALTYDPAGRARVRGGCDFSISYCGTGAWLLLGAGTGRVGLDVVDARRGGPLLDAAIAGAEERAAIGPHPRADVLVWAAKEAAAKLTGEVARDPAEWRLRERGGCLSVTAAGLAPIRVTLLTLPGGETAALAGEGREGLAPRLAMPGRTAA